MQHVAWMGLATLCWGYFERPDDNLAEPMDHEQNRRTEVEQLLAEGLHYFGQGRTSEAVVCWTRVIELEPDEPRALDYLEAAGFEPAGSAGGLVRIDPVRPSPPAVPQETQNAVTDALRHSKSAVVRRVRVEELVKQQRYEDALELLYEERRKAPGDASLSRSIRLLKEHLRRRYQRELGDLSRVAHRTGVGLEANYNGASLCEAHREIFALVDGIASLEDVIASATGTRYRIFRCLHELVAAGAVELLNEGTAGDQRSHGAPHPVAMALEPPPRSAQPQPQQQSQPEPVGRPQVPAPIEPDFDAIFDSALRAYLRRDYEVAEHLFQRCRELRADDRRVEHNLRKLEQRKRRR